MYSLCCVNNSIYVHLENNSSLLHSLNYSAEENLISEYFTRGSLCCVTLLVMCHVSLKEQSTLNATLKNCSAKSHV